MIKKHFKVFWATVRESWDDPVSWGLLAIMSISYFVWMSVFSAVFATLSSLCLGVYMHAKGALHGMAVMQSIHDGTYDGPYSEPEPPAANPQPVDKEWNEDQL